MWYPFDKWLHWLYIKEKQHQHQHHKVSLIVYCCCCFELSHMHKGNQATELQKQTKLGEIKIYIQFSIFITFWFWFKWFFLKCLHAFSSLSRFFWLENSFNFGEKLLKDCSWVQIPILIHLNVNDYHLPSHLYFHSLHFHQKQINFILHFIIQTFFYPLSLYILCFHHAPRVLADR